jgi:hypothetical protein
MADKQVVIGYIDTRTRIVVEDNCFLLEQRKRRKDNCEFVWVGKHYFSWLSDLFRYYLRIYLRNENRIAETERVLLRLLDKLTALETKMDEVGKRLQTEWEKSSEKSRSEKS